MLKMFWNMKNLFFIAAIFCTLLCGTAFASDGTIRDEKEISEIISNYYQGLKDYYDSGLIRVESLNETTLFDGSKEYKIKYKYVKNFYDQSEIDGVLMKEFPRLYSLKKMGLVKDVCVYRYVDKETGEIRTDTAYNRNLPSRGFKPARMAENSHNGNVRRHRHEPRMRLAR